MAGQILLVDVLALGCSWCGEPLRASSPGCEPVGNCVCAWLAQACLLTSSWQGSSWFVRPHTHRLHLQHLLSVRCPCVQ